MVVTLCFTFALHVKYLKSCQDRVRHSGGGSLFLEAISSARRRWEAQGFVRVPGPPKNGAGRDHCGSQFLTLAVARSPPTLERGGCSPIRAYPRNVVQSLNFLVITIVLVYVVSVAALFPISHPRDPCGKSDDGLSGKRHLALLRLLWKACILASMNQETSISWFWLFALCILYLVARTSRMHSDHWHWRSSCVCEISLVPKCILCYHSLRVRKCDVLPSPRYKIRCWCMSFLAVRKTSTCGHVHTVLKMWNVCRILRTGPTQEKSARQNYYVHSNNLFGATVFYRGRNITQSSTRKTSWVATILWMLAYLPEVNISVLTWISRINYHEKLLNDQ